MTTANDSNPAPQLMHREAGWNKLAITALVIPIAVFLLAQVLGRVLGTVGMDAAGVSRQDVNQLLANSLIVVIIELVLYVAGVVVGHLSLRPQYRPLRGRPMGIVGLVLSYIGAAFCLLGLVAIIVLPILIGNNPDLFAGA